MIVRSRAADPSFSILWTASAPVPCLFVCLFANELTVNGLASMLGVDHDKPNSPVSFNAVLKTEVSQAAI